jgi:hypothetical protein
MALLQQMILAKETFPDLDVARVNSITEIFDSPDTLEIMQC